MQTAEPWETKAIWAREKRDSSLAKVKPKLHGIPAERELPTNTRSLPHAALTSREIEITEQYGITELLAILRNRSISVEEVTRAFLRRAAVAHAAVRTSGPLLYETADI
jgi:amidase